MDDSPFARLPGELRNQIWRDALIEARPIDITYRPNRELTPLPGLLAACGTIRREATSIYYSENVFEVEFEYMDRFAIGPRYLRDPAARCARWDRANLSKLSKLQVCMPPHGAAYWFSQDVAAFPALLENYRLSQDPSSLAQNEWIAESAGDLLEEMQDLAIRPEVVEIVFGMTTWDEDDVHKVLFQEAFEAAREARSNARDSERKRRRTELSDN